MKDTFCTQLFCMHFYIYFAHISYEFCIQILYIVLMISTFCRSELMYTKHIQNVYNMYPIFQQSFIYILHTNLSCHSSFNSVYKMYTKVCQNVGYIFYISILYTFCIHQLYTNCTIFVDKIYT